MIWLECIAGISPVGDLYNSVERQFFTRVFLFFMIPLHSGIQEALAGFFIIPVFSSNEYY